MKKNNDFHRTNLRKLATFLKENASKFKFDMKYYNVSPDGTFTSYYNVVNPNPICGTVACAVGNGPRAGILPLPDEMWDDYVERNFTGDNYFIFEFLFESTWEVFDNTVLGAAARIQYFLDHEDTIDDYYNSYNPSIYSSYLKGN